MNGTTLTKTYSAPPIDKKEILRYAGGIADDNTIKLLNECINEAINCITYKVCYCELPVKTNGDLCDFGLFCVQSKNLATNLSGCNSVIIFGATVGIGIDRLITNLEKLAFFAELAKYLKPQIDDKDVVRNIIIDGLGYGSKPKGLVTFHAYKEGARKPVEEHLVEAALYASNGERAAIHFTVSPEHREGFLKLLEERQSYYEQKYGIKYDVSFSEQSPATDTIAVNLDNTPFRTDDGKLCRMFTGEVTSHPQEESDDTDEIMGGDAQ